MFGCAERAALGGVGLLLALAPAAPATAAGELDESFSGDGKLIADFGTRNDGAHDVAVQPDGRIVVATGSGLVRYTSTGALDPSFSGDGRVPDVPDPFGSRGLAIQPDGRIVAIISTGIARYRPDGTLDASFSGDGRAEIACPSSLALGADGKLLVAGRQPTSQGSCGEEYLTRLRSDGSVDTSFAGNGTATNDSPYNILGLAVQPDGRVVTAEALSHAPTGFSSFGVGRLTVEGREDRSFNGSGFRDLDSDFGDSGSTFGSNVAIHSDGKIVALGEFSDDCDCRDRGALAVTRLNRDGSLDRRFSRDGKRLVRFGGDASGNGVALQPDGGIVLAGSTDPLRRPTTDFALARLRGDGSLSGKAVTSLGRVDGAHAVAIQPGGRIMAAGSTGRRGDVHLALARYRNLRIDRPQARLVFRRRQRLGRVLRRGVVLRLRTKGLVQGSVRLVGGRRTLRRSSPRIYRRGSTTVRVRLSRRAKRRLRHRGGGRLLLRVRLVNAEGTSRLLKARVRVR